MDRRVLASVVPLLAAVALFASGCGESSSSESDTSSTNTTPPTAQAPKPPANEGAATNAAPANATSGAGAAASSGEEQKPSTDKPPADGKKVVTTASGLKYSDLKEGTGPAAKTGNTVKVHYTGWLTDGKQFDSSVKRGEPIELTLGQGRVIKGWEEGLVGMKKGGRRKLTIPAKLAYGEEGRPPVIPPNATLIFDCVMVDIQPS